MKLDETAALISLEEAKEYLAVESTPSDEILKLFLNAVGVWVTGYLGRNLLAKAYTEYYTGNGGKVLVLRNHPVISISTIHVDSLRAFGTSSLVNLSGNVMVNKPAGILTAWNALGIWSPGTANIKVVYTAGYELASMPHDVRLAVKRIMDKQFRHGYTNRKLDTATETMGEQTTTFREDAVPKDAKSMLDRYMNHGRAECFEYAD